MKIKRIHIFSLLVAVFTLLYTLSGCGDASTASVSTSDTHPSRIEKAAYSPHNTFSDVDADFAYIAINAGGSDSGFKILKKSLTDGKFGTYDILFAGKGTCIRSLAVWEKYIYFLADNSLYRIDKDGSNHICLLTDEQLNDERVGSGACAFVRVAGDKLYVDTNELFDGYRIYDLSQSDTAQIFDDNTSHTPEHPATTPFNALCENWKYSTPPHDVILPDRVSFVLPTINARYICGETNIGAYRALFDYGSSRVLGWCNENHHQIEIYGFDGTRQKTMPITYNGFAIGDGKLNYHLFVWGNASNGKAYGFAYPFLDTEYGKSRPSTDTYSLFVYDIDDETETVIDMPRELRVYPRYTDIDVIGNYVYWRNETGQLVCCDPADRSVSVVASFE